MKYFQIKLKQKGKQTMKERNLLTRTKETPNNNDNWLLEACEQINICTNVLFKEQNKDLNNMSNHE